MTGTERAGQVTVPTCLQRHGHGRVREHSPHGETHKRGRGVHAACRSAAVEPNTQATQGISLAPLRLQTKKKITAGGGALVLE